MKSIGKIIGISSLALLTAAQPYGLCNDVNSKISEAESHQKERDIINEFDDPNFEKACNYLLDADSGYSVICKMFVKGLDAILPETNLARSFNFLEMSGLYADCLSDLTLCVRYRTALDGEFEKAGLNKSKIKNIEILVDMLESLQLEQKEEEGVTRKLFERACEYSENSSQISLDLIIEIWNFEENKNNFGQLVPDYKRFIDRLNKRMEKGFSHKVNISKWWLREDGRLFANENEIKKEYFVNCLKRFSSCAVLQETEKAGEENLYLIDELKFNLNLGELYLKLAQKERDMPMVQKYVIIDFAKERYKKVLELTKEKKDSETLNLREKVKGFIEELEKDK